MNKRILISGASIAGLTLAYWLERYGFRPTVIERAPKLRAVGNGVDIREQAIEVAKRMGIMQVIQKKARDTMGMSFVNADNKVIGRIDMNESRQKSSSGEVEIMRGDLVALLYEVANNVEYIFDDSIQKIEQSNDGLTVFFEKNPSRPFDLVIGADGIHSNVRRLVFGPESQFVHFKDHYFAFASADVPWGESRWMTMFNMPGKMAGVYRSGNHSKGEAYFIFRSPNQLSYDFRNIEQQKDILREAYAGETSWRIQELLSAVLSNPDFYFDALSQVQMPSWSSGRVALVGDAAYCASPASGAGAMLAMIGAYRLAGELAAAAGDHNVAFQQYEEGFRETVKRKHQIGPGVKMMVPKSYFGMWIRNTLARSLLFESVSKMAKKQIEPLPIYK